jgi:hypothetical protein
VIRLLLHPAVLLLIAAVAFFVWARRVNLRVRLTRLPTQREWAVLAMLAQALRWLLRVRI